MHMCRHTFVVYYFESTCIHIKDFYCRRWKNIVKLQWPECRYAILYPALVDIKHFILLISISHLMLREDKVPSYFEQQFIKKLAICR